MLELVLVFLEGFGDGTDGIAVVYHTYLDSVGMDVIHHCFNLSLHDFRLYILYAIYSLGVLHGDGCDGRTGINAQGRHRLDVCLNTGSSATVGSGNSQCCIVFHIFFIFILFILDLLIYL